MTSTFVRNKDSGHRVKLKKKSKVCFETTQEETDEPYTDYKKFKTDSCLVA